MINIWGTTTGEVGQSRYISMMSLAYDEITAKTRFKQLSEYIKTNGTTLDYYQIVTDRKLHELFDDILDGLERDHEDAQFSFNHVDKTYLRFMSYYSNQLEGEKQTGIAHIKALDDIFEEIDIDLLSKFPDLDEKEMNRLDGEVRSLLGKYNHTTSQKHLVKNPESYSYGKIDKDNYRDAHILESIYYVWFINVLKANNIDDVTEVITSPKLATYIKKLMIKIFDEWGADTNCVKTIISPKTELYSSINFFFRTLHRIVISAIENMKNGDVNPKQKDFERGMFRKVWQTMSKESSIWMIPSRLYSDLFIAKVNI